MSNGSLGVIIKIFGAAQYIRVIPNPDGITIRTPIPVNPLTVYFIGYVILSQKIFYLQQEELYPLRVWSFYYKLINY